MIRIQMGNDEFILYIRKNSHTTKTNDVLGREIWNWIKKNDPTATEIIKNQDCHWGNSGSFIADDNLPKTSTQFEFDIRLLISLYPFLLTL
ncbi:MAG: hypothetical protein RBT61_10725 [Candidatus Kapabacteria bacterium]|jgi:hypothetical protein|nr:hypothetical protein [Candidatus Kapabacteria bacterium]